MATNQTPLERAVGAGRALLAEGEGATASAIRARAGVAMSTAVEAARVIRAEGCEVAAPEATEVPEAVTAAARALWQVAQQEARHALEVDRQMFLARLREAEAETQAARAELDALAAEVDTLTAELTKARRAAASKPARRPTRETATPAE